jgi:riboflavin biosynthesis pyrimidine reductase
VAAGDEISGAIRALLAFDITALLVEGGAVIHQALFAAEVVDTVHLIVSSNRLGPGGVPVFGTGVVGVPGLTPATITELGPDRWMEFDVHGNR